MRASFGLELPSRLGTTLSLEELEKLEGIDVAFTATTPEEVAAGTDPLDSLKDDTLWKGLPFVQDNAIHTFDMEMFYGSPSGQTAFLDIVEKALPG